MVSYSAKLDSSTKQHTQFGVSASNGSRDMARTKSRRKKKKKKMNVDDSIKHPLRGSLNNNNNNDTGSRSPCMRPRSDPPNFGPIERGEKQTNNID